MRKVEAYLKWKLGQYPTNMWWRSRYLMLRNRLEISTGNSVDFLVSDGT